MFYEREVLIVSETLGYFILSAMLGYFFVKLDSIEKKLDKVENSLISIKKRKSDFHRSRVIRR
jgi:hypothetical protein